MLASVWAAQTFQRMNIDRKEICILLQNCLHSATSPPNPLGLDACCWHDATCLSGVEGLENLTSQPEAVQELAEEML